MTLPSSATLYSHSHYAIVDSGTPLHVFRENLFLNNAVEDHTCLSGFQGSHTRAVARADLSCRLLTTDNQLLHHIEKNSVLLVPDTVKNLFSVRVAASLGHQIVMTNESAGMYLDGSTHFVPFVNDPSSGLWLLPLYASAQSTNDLYAIAPPIIAPVSVNAGPALTQEQAIVNASAAPSDYPQSSEDRDQALTLHHQLGHINNQRIRSLDIKGVPPAKGQRHFQCPTCLASKARRHPLPHASKPESRISVPWSEIHADLSGKMIRTKRGNQYFCPFVCRYTGAKHVIFLTRKSHFVVAYKSFVSTIGKHPSVLRTDLGSEFICKDLAKILADNYVKHIICAPGEHDQNGVAENAILTLRNSTKAMMLFAQIPLHLWDYCLSHAAYLNNITSPCRADKSKTIFEYLTGHKADLTRIPPLGAFTCIHLDRRQLSNQSLGLPSLQGAFIGICEHRKILGYCVYTADHKVRVTRIHLAFDPRLYPFKATHKAPSIWESHTKLMNGGPNKDTTSIDLQAPPDSATLMAPADEDGAHPPVPESSEDDEDEEENEEEEDDDDDEEEESPAKTQAPSSKRQKIPNSKYIDKAQEPKPMSNHSKYHSDKVHKETRDQLVNTTITKHFDGHGSFKGTIKEYYPSTDNYHILYEDNDDEVMTYKKLQKYIPGTTEYQRQASANMAMFSFATAIDDARHATTANLEQAHETPCNWKQAMASPEAANWSKGQDEEMANLRSRNCWTVVRRNDLPAGALVMGSLWAYRHKLDENGNVSRYRSRFCGKGFTQVLGESHFETFSPVVCFVTIRLLFALTSLPGFDVFQYDVSVAFIEAELDPNSPPIYVECAEGFENRKEYVYKLHKYLYGMKDAPRGYYQLFAKLCLERGMRQLKTDECVFIHTLNNSKSNPQHNVNLSDPAAFNMVIPADDRIHADCPHRTAIIIVATYVDDNLVFTNCKQMRESFQTDINTRLKMNLEGPVRWYLSVKYERDEVTGAVSTSQETYINKILKRWGMSECKSLTTPTPAKTDQMLSDLAAPVGTVDPILRKQYQELVGQLLYLQVHTVPEISWILSQLSRYMVSPGDIHLATAKKVLRYLQGRKKIPLRWCAQDSKSPHPPGVVYGYADASFADVDPTKLSTIGYCFLVNNAAVSWRCSKTSLQVLSAAEAELVSLCAAAQEGVFLRKLCQELGFVQHTPTIIYEDCEAAVALSKENRFRKRSKHFALRWHYIIERQRAEHNDIQAIRVSRTLMLADIFASPRPEASFVPFRNQALGYHK